MSLSAAHRPAAGGSVPQHDSSSIRMTGTAGPCADANTLDPCQARRRSTAEAVRRTCLAGCIRASSQSPTYIGMVPCQAARARIVPKPSLLGSTSQQQGPAHAHSVLCNAMASVRCKRLALHRHDPDGRASHPLSPASCRTPPAQQLARPCIGSPFRWCSSVWHNPVVLVRPHRLRVESLCVSNEASKGQLLFHSPTLSQWNAPSKCSN